MKKLFFFFMITFCVLSSTDAQIVGIGTATPDASAMLEIKSTNKGFLIPRFTTVQISSILNPAKGLMVLDTITNQLMINMGTAIVPDWQNLVTGSGWGLNGNSGTTTLNFLGTADSNPLYFKVNNQQSGLINHLAQNSFYGYLSGNSISTGNNNTAMGASALFANTTGSYNTATGASALRLNSTGYNNTAFGTASLFSNTTGSRNVASGDSALYFNSSGGHNIAIGSKALFSNIIGVQNTAIGTEALFTNTGHYNTANGTGALGSNTTGQGNTAIGMFSSFLNSTGNYNTAMGYSAMNANQTGSWNTCLGEYTNVSVTNLNGATAIGTGAITNADNKIVIGAALPGTMVIGGYAAWSNLSDGRFKTNVQDDVPGLNFITKLKPVSYNIDTRKLDLFLTQNMPDSIGNHYLKQDDVYSKSMLLRHTGFIAQDVEKIAAGIGWKFDAVNAPKNPGDNYSIAYSQFVMPLVKAVQELQQQIETLQKENVELKKELADLRKEMQELKKLIISKN